MTFVLCNFEIFRATESFRHSRLWIHLCTPPKRCVTLRTDCLQVTSLLTFASPLSQPPSFLDTLLYQPANNSDRAPIYRSPNSSLKLLFLFLICLRPNHGQPSKPSSPVTSPSHRHHRRRHRRPLLHPRSPQAPPHLRPHLRSRPNLLRIRRRCRNRSQCPNSLEAHIPSSWKSIHRNDDAESLAFA